MSDAAAGSFWRDRPTLVTGASGLLGGAVVRRLVDRQARVLALVRPDTTLDPAVSDHITIVRGDVRDPSRVEKALTEHRIDTVLHIAAQAIVATANREPVPTWETNVAGTWNVLDACRRSPHVERIVVSSSDKAYGDAGTEPYAEETPLEGRHPYEASKACADLITQSYAATFDLPVAITRCGNFYGPGDLNWNRIVPSTIRSVVGGEAPVIRSDGKSVRNYVYVDDGAAATLLLAERVGLDPSLHGHAFNFSDEAPVTVLDLVRTILRLMESDLEPVVRNEAPHEIAYQSLSAAKARQMLDWSPLYTLEEGLGLTIPWYVDYLSCNAVTE